MRITSAQALIISTASKPPQISFVSRWTWPFIQHVEVLDLLPKQITLSFVEHESLLSKDYFRFHLVVTFQVAVLRTESDITRIAQMIGIQRANDQHSLEELFVPKLVELIQVQVLRQDRATLNEDVGSLKQALVQEMEDWDNMGFCITLHRLDRCAEADLSCYNTDNILEVQSYKVLVEEDTERRVAENRSRVAALKEQALERFKQRHHEGG